jgi:glycerophosphoryl diester phosphodiesterase
MAWFATGGGGYFVTGETFMRLLTFVLGLMLLAAVPVAAAPPELIAHRGASHRAPENTMAAVELAWKLDADAVEVDVRLSKDGVIVCRHDRTTERTAGVAKSVAEQTYRELRRLDVGSWKGERFAGTRIPRLKRVVASIPKGKRLFIEIKTGPQIVAKLKRLLQESGKRPRQTVIISFNEKVVRRASEALPKRKVFWLSGFQKDEATGQWSPKVPALIERAEAMGADGLDLQAAKPIRTKAAVEAVHEAGLELYVWTVNGPAKAQQLARLGVAGITTDRPAWLARKLAEQDAQP